MFTGELLVYYNCVTSMTLHYVYDIMLTEDAEYVLYYWKEVRHVVFDQRVLNLKHGYPQVSNLKNNKKTKEVNLMSKVRKFMAVAIVFAMVLGMMVPAFALSNDVVGTEYEDAAAKLGALEIMIGDEGGFRPNDNIKRSEFAKIAVVSLGLESAADTAGGMTKFDDVSSNHWASGYINVASSQKIIVGDGDGNFRPDDEITYAEALTILVRIAGYGPVVEGQGMWPVNYIAKAAGLGITDDINVSASDDATRGVIAQLTVNTLTADIMEQTGFGEDTNYEVKKGENLLTNKLDVDKLEGIVTAVDTDEAEVTIGGTTYEAGNTNALDLLGYNVEFYANSDDVLIMVSEEDNTVVTIDEYDALTNTGDDVTLTYEKDDKVKTAEFTVDPTVVIYNNDELADGAAVAALGTTVNHWTLIDNDNDDVYDYVFATEYTTHVVDEVNAEDEIVYNKLGSAIDLSDEDVITVISKNGNVIDFTELQEWDVLEVLENNAGDYREIMVVNETVEGSIGAKASATTVIIGYSDYSVLANAVDVDGNAYTPQLGDKGIFYLDSEGDIIAANLDEEGTDQFAYGYVIKGYKTSTFGVDDVRLTILTAAGEEVVIEVADELEVNGTSVEEKDITADATASIDTVANGVTISGELVKYGLNSNGEMKSVLTSAHADLTEDSASADRDFNENTNMLGNYKVTTDTLVFYADGTDFEVYSLTNLEDAGTYTSVIYDAGTTLKPKAVLVTAGSFDGSADTAIAVVVSILDILDEEDNTIKQLVGYVQNGMALYSEGTGYANNYSPVGALAQLPGTIVEVTLNGDGEMIELDDPTNAIVSGTVYDKDADSMVVWTGSQTEVFTLADTVYVYENDVEDNAVSVASISDIKTKEQTTKNASEIELHQDEDGLVDVIVIKVDVR